MNMMRVVLVTSCTAVLLVLTPNAHAFTCAHVRKAAAGYSIQQIVAWARANLTPMQITAARKCFVGPQQTQFISTQPSVMGPLMSSVPMIVTSPSSCFCPWSTPRSPHYAV